MTERAIFNRKYTSFNSGGTQVWLVNGAGVTTESTSTISVTAGEALIQGDFVRISGAYVVKATALSGLAPNNYAVVGATTEAATQGSAVSVSTDGVVVLSSSNITASGSLVPGTQYYLSKYYGQIVTYSSASGLVTNSGTNQYQALVPVGQALSASELSIEIQPEIVLYD
jgi:hypothetical protein